MTPTVVLLAHPGSELYGSDRVVLETALVLQGADHRVVVTVPEPGPLTDLLTARGVTVEVVPTPVLRKSALRPTGLVRLAVAAARAVRPGLAVLRRHDVDVVLVNTVTVPVWPVLARLTRRPVVAHVHEAERSAAPVLRRALALPLLLAGRVVTNSRFSRDVLVDALPRLAARTVVVPNPVPGPPEVVPARPTPSDPLQLLFVGRLSPRKGPDVAVDALARLVADGVDAHLGLLGAVFPGYEWFEADLRAAVARHGLTDRVRFLGFQPDVWPHLAAADVVLVPSTVDEPFGNTAVEAVLAARPAVVSRTSGLIEAVDGYRGVEQVPPGDPAALAAAVRRIRDDWDARGARVRADVDLAADRHGAAAYQDRMVAAVAAVGRDRRGSAPDPDPSRPRGATRDGVVVALASYRRPDDLALALTALLPEVASLDPAATLLVVDNDPDRSAHPVAARFADRGVRVVHEPRPGIAAARNRALAEAGDARRVVFLDDDEQPEPGWLAALCATADRTGAGAVAGPVLSVFDSTPDAWVDAGRFFDRRRLPTGTPVVEAATNNLLLDLDRTGPIVFDEAFGLTGGSDTVLTRSLARRGVPMVWCDEAIVLDRVPAARITRDWVLRRAFRMANTSTRVDLLLAPAGPARVRVRLRDTARGGTRLVGGGLRIAQGAVTRRAGTRVRGVRTVYRGAGMVAGAAGFVYSEYSRDTARRRWPVRWQARP